VNLPPTWALLPLSDLCSLITDGTHFSPRTQNSGYPYITVRDLSDGAIDFTNCKFISGDDFETLLKNGCSPQRGDVLFSKDGTVGKVALVNTDEDFVVLSSLAILRPKSEIVDGRYLALALESPTVLESALGMKTGTAIRRVVLRTLKQLLIPVPPLEEQRRIVATLEDNLSRLDKALAEVDSVKRLLDDQWLSFTSSLLNGAFSSGDSAFKRWNVKTINDLVDSPKDIVDGPFGSNLKSSHYSAHGARVVRLQNIGYGSWVEADAFVPIEHAQTLQKHNVRKGDLLFASLMDLSPRVCIAPDLGENAIVKSDCIRIRFANQDLARWVLLATQTLTARLWAQNSVHGLGRGRLGLTAIRSFEVATPPTPHLLELLDMAEEVRAEIQESQKACLQVEEKSKQLRRSLLQQAFSGKLV
jgi:type I restriction enzyme S subunit